MLRNSRKYFLREIPYVIKDEVDISEGKVREGRKTGEIGVKQLIAVHQKHRLRVVKLLWRNK